MALEHEYSSSPSDDGFVADVEGSPPPRYRSSPAPEAPPVSSSPGRYESDSEDFPSPVRARKRHTGDETPSVGSTSSQSTVEFFYGAAASAVQRPVLQNVHGNGLALALVNERLLQVSTQMAEGYLPNVWRSASEGNILPTIPESVEGYRLIRRAPSGKPAEDPEATPRKYRKVEEHNQYSTPSSNWVPTAPTSPVNHKIRQNPTPIIAPPPFYYPSLPVGPDTTAKIRLVKFLERERNERFRDGLPLPFHGFDAMTKDAARYQQLSDQWENAIGLGTTLRERAITWIASILPKHPSGGLTSRSVSSTSSMSSSASSFASTSSCASSRITNLYDQLSSCPETRFHAVWMFLRYFFLVAGRNGSPATNNPQEEFDALIVWDIALACLALSVKFHRDFLTPLYPIQALEFLELARHDVEWEEFESAQRGVLSAFGYSVGVTPQPVADELWRALPSLRDLLHFEGGWNALQKEAWLRLYDVVLVPDLLRFPQSHLMATALIDALPPFLAKRFEYDAPWHCKTIRKKGSRPSDHAQARAARFLRQAKEASEGVIQDIQEVVGITNAQVRECQEWWRLSCQGLSMA